MTTTREHAENVALWESLAPAPRQGESYAEARAIEAAEAEAEARAEIAATSDPFNGDRFATW
jgi:hypothetical protein